VNPDVVRYLIAGVAAVLAALALGCAVRWRDHDVLGYLAVLAMAVVSVSGQLDAIGTPLTWRTWALGVGVVLAAAWCVSVIARRFGAARA
jgi:hypothetical protein